MKFNRAVINISRKVLQGIVKFNIMFEQNL
jgi:hypothetical protein